MRHVHQRILLLALAVATVAGTARAQLNGHNLLGDQGVGAGTQPAPGFYTGLLYYRYHTDTIRNRNGDRLQPGPSERHDLSVNSAMPIVYYVTKARILGGNYGAFAAMPFANAALEAPGLDLQSKLDTGASDLYIQPMNLGWHGKSADFFTAVGLFLPTGRYTAGATDNTGKGMWSLELSGGSTVYLDQGKTWSAATTAFWETHSDKQDSDVRVGQLLTLEGGLGKSFLGGGLKFGAAYYAQWKLTDDDFGLDLPAALRPGKHRAYGIGPDVTVPVATKSTLLALVNVRYLWETGVRSKTDGESLVVTATIPLPSTKLK